MHVAQLYHKRVTLADNKSIQNTEAPFVLNENSGLGTFILWPVGQYPMAR